MITEAEQKILDGAPDGAEFFRVGFNGWFDAYFNGDKSRIVYVGTRDESWENYTIDGFKFDFVVLAELRKKQGKILFETKPDIEGILKRESDLRKKQGKTVFDAVNYFKCEPWNNKDGGGFYHEHFGIHHSGGLVCTIEEFNQCVDDLTKNANGLLPCAHNYAMHKMNYAIGFSAKCLAERMSEAGMSINNSMPSVKAALDNLNKAVKKSKIIKEKPRVKVEYVKVVGSIFTLKDDFDAGLLFGKSNGEHFPITSEHRMTNLVCHNALYRKVETEITWQDELQELNSNVIISKGLVGMTPVSEDEFIEICHLVDSMTKPIK